METFVSCAGMQGLSNVDSVAVWFPPVTAVLISRRLRRTREEHTVEYDGITQDGIHSLRVKRCRPVGGISTSNRDDDIFGRHHTNTGKNLERAGVS